MRTIDIGIGIPLGLIAFWGLSLASAFWVGPSSSLDYLWSALLSAAVCCVLGAVVSTRAMGAIVAAGVMLILVVIGLVAGSDSYLVIRPLPFDIRSLVFHGSRTPVVIGPLLLVATAGMVRSVLLRRREVSDHGERSRDAEVEGVAK